VDVWASCDAWNGVSKDEEWNLFGTQEVYKGNAFLAIRMKTHIHSLTVIESPTIVNFGLSKRRCR
jgi:hypothetical protein